MYFPEFNGIRVNIVSNNGRASMQVHDARTHLSSLARLCVHPGVYLTAILLVAVLVLTVKWETPELRIEPVSRRSEARHNKYLRRQQTSRAQMSPASFVLRVDVL